jgi:hypothetical protein
MRLASILLSLLVAAAACGGGPRTTATATPAPVRPHEPRADDGCPDPTLRVRPGCAAPDDFVEGCYAPCLAAPETATVERCGPGFECRQTQEWPMAVGGTAAVCSSPIELCLPVAP